eukprot:TRINITY_DN2796_c5_g1_i1.p1 TRINITY_DN2796_c5_g1~~TRINITY_DN2796_c5_g1_i1.p1  ORF type:complete len:255 (+),score=39.13 TRINITY_DN2796_c5_g1_i1:49-813(+)
MFRRTVVRASVMEITMNKGVNVLARSLAQDITEKVQKAQTDGTTGIILTSNTKVFSAGLDLMEMYDAKEENLREYWKIIQDLWLSIYLSEVPIIAAINGASPAGGCMMACACDYRIIVDSPKAVIGLNESLIGLVAPFWLARNFIDTLNSKRLGEYHLQKGTLLPPQGALSLGLVDEVCSADDLLKAAHSELESFLKIPKPGRAAAKLLCRTPLANELINNREADTDQFIKCVTDPTVQSFLASYVKSMKAKSA